MLESGRKYFLIALVLGLLIHGSTLLYTFENTYDAYVHMFFADHYSNGWFDSWNYKWYTGFTITSYPPLVHQVIALCSFVIGLKGGFFLWSMVVVLLLVRGIYHFSKLWVDDVSAGLASIFMVISSSVAEALHVFGQLPSLTGIALLLNACPEIYKWLRFRNRIHLFAALTLLATITSAHHVSTIFGMVFFVLPVMGLALMDRSENEYGNFKWPQFIKTCLSNLPRAFFFGCSVIALTLIVIFPYWYWSGTDPITQVSIPHGSRDSFLENTSSGLVFFLIPWGILILCFSQIGTQLFKRRNLFLAISIILSFVLGTGGTTPIPKMLLGENAFNILTLDRFSFWSSILVLPFVGLFLKTLYFKSNEMLSGWKNYTTQLLKFFFAIVAIGFFAFTVNVGHFRPLQPNKIDVKPIVNFLERDGHDRWRYLTLGFGDQMAWLGANTNAMTVDGNYHSVRRLPEMTTRAVERLENAKYLGDEGIASLRAFLSKPEKYNLKFVFSNDKFYEPILYFSGWTFVQNLENNIQLWERPDVAILPAVIPDKSIPEYQRLLWGILPLLCAVLALLFQLMIRLYRDKSVTEDAKTGNMTLIHGFHFLWYLISLLFFAGILYFAWYNNSKQNTPKHLLTNYFHALDFKKFEDAYQYLDPETRPEKDQYLLELSLEDGILASYAKLNSLNYSLEKLDENNIKTRVDIDWVTSLKSYSTNEDLELVKRKNKWYVKHKPYEMKTPSDQLVKVAELDFKQQGRRRAEVDKTRLEDVLDRPEIFVSGGNLVKKDGKYSVVGEVLNLDNDPAYVTIEAELYDLNGLPVAKQSASEHLIQNLLPKERSAFRIDFDSIQNQNQLQMAIFVRSVVQDKYFYKYQGVQGLRIDSLSANGEYHNNGTKEISIPYIMIPRFVNDDLVWVDDFYLDKGIRPQRFKSFDLNLTPLHEIEILQKGSLENFIVNGVPCSELQAYFPLDTKLSKASIYVNGLVAKE